MDDLDTRFDGLVFDMDGTLADTMPTHFVAWTRTMERYGIEFPEARFYALGGVPAPVITAMLAEEQSVELDAELAAEEKEALFLELIGEVQPVAHVKAIAERYRGVLPMAVATGSPGWVAEKILNALGIRDWFGAVVGAESVEHPKPAPDIFIKAAREIGVDPARCHAFEDTKLGLEAARRAGMTAVDVTAM